MADLKVEIVSVEGVLFKGSCAIAVVPALSGDIGIMHGHEAIISNLSQGEIKLIDSADNIFKSFAIEKGFAEMQGEEKLSILVNQ